MKLPTPTPRNRLTFAPIHLCEQDDVRPAVAESIERAVGSELEELLALGT